MTDNLPREFWHPAAEHGMTIVAAFETARPATMIAFPVRPGLDGIEALRRVVDTFAPERRTAYTWQAYPA